MEVGAYSKLEDLDFKFTIKSVSKRELFLSLEFLKPILVSKDFEERDYLVLEFFFADGRSKRTRREIPAQLPLGGIEEELAEAAPAATGLG